VNPVFDESFTFPGVDAGRLLKRGSAVRLSVFNTDSFSKDSLVGELLLPLDEVDLQSEISVTVIRPLGHTVTKVTHPSPFYMFLLRFNGKVQYT